MPDAHSALSVLPLLSPERMHAQVFNNVYLSVLQAR